jgi:hypothetical protein
LFARPLTRQVRRDRAWRNGVKKVIIPWGTSRKDHASIMAAGSMTSGPVKTNDGPVIQMTGLVGCCFFPNSRQQVDVLVTGRKDIYVGQLVCLVPPLRNESEMIAVKTFGQTETRRALLVEPFDGNENIDIDHVRTMLSINERRKPDWNTAKPDLAVELDITEDVVTFSVVEFTRKVMLHTMTQTQCMAVAGWDPATQTGKDLFKSKLDANYALLYTQNPNKLEVFKLPGFGTATPSRYVELLACDMLMDQADTLSTKRFPPTTHNLLGALHMNLDMDMEWIVGRAVTTGVPGNMMTINMGLLRP